MVWIMNRSKPCTERLAKLAEILGGWQQHFRGERTVSDILEYAALVFMTRNKEELDSVMARRPAFRNIYKDLMTYFQTIWMQKDRQDLILLEYEQFTGISDGNSIAGALSSDQIQKLNTLYDQTLSDMSEESYTELMQLYSDFHQFQKADMAADIIDRIHCRRKTESADQAALLSKETHSMDTDSPDSHQSYSTWSPRSYRQISAALFRQRGYLRTAGNHCRKKKPGHAARAPLPGRGKEASGRRMHSSDLCAEAQRHGKIYGDRH
jgi:hypothetical protein